VLLAAALSALVAFFIRGFSGFGAMLVLTPLLLLTLDLRTVVVSAALVSFLSGLVVTAQSHRHADWHELRVLVLVALPGLIAGGIILSRLDTSVLGRLLGVATVLFALRILLAQRRMERAPKPWPRPTLYVAGGLSGLMGGAFGISGPPVLVYLEQRLGSRRSLRATMLAYFLALDISRLALYAITGLLTWKAATTGLAMLPASILGGQLGTMLHDRASEAHFRVAVAVLLLSTGVLLVVR
jgi:uncharacterized membrane protein YfcA